MSDSEGGWRQIESAPKNRVPVFLRCKTAWGEIKHYADCVWIGDWGMPGWYEKNRLHYECYPIPYEATHWFPIPLLTAR